MRICAAGHFTAPFNGEDCLVCGKPAVELARALAAAREEGLAAGFADCEVLAGAMARSLAVDLESGKISVPGHAGDALAGKIASWALNFFALALNLGQHRTDEYDSTEILAAHRAAVNRSQAAKAGRAGGLAAAAGMSKKAKTARARSAAKARHGRAKEGDK